MTFQAKRSLVSFAVIWIGAVGYAAAALRSPPLMDAAPRLIGAAISLTFMMIIGHVLLTIGAGEDEARRPLDDRDRQVRLTARASSARALAVGLVLVIGLGLFGVPAWIVTQVAVAAFVAAELVRYGLELFHYRRAG